MELQVTNSWTVAKGSYAEIKWLRGLLTIVGRRLIKQHGKLTSVQTETKFLDSTNRFQTGLLPVVLEAVSQEIDIIIVDKRIVPLGIKDVPESLNGLQLRDDQVRAAETILTACRGVLEWPGGSGKSEVAIAACSAFVGFLKALILVDRVDLLNQWVFRLKLRGIPKKDIGIISSKEINPQKFTVAMVKTLSARLINPDVRDYLKQVNVLIIDESHLAGSKTYQKVIKHIENAYWRFGLSATPFDYALERNYVVIGLIGPVIVQQSILPAIQRGILPEMVYHYLPVPTHFTPPITPPCNKSNYREEYSLYLFNNSYIYNLYRYITCYSEYREDKFLITLNEIEHGVLLSRAIPESIFISALYSYSSHARVLIKGLVKALTREKVIEMFNKNTCKRLISSPILDFGIDLKDLHHVVLAGALESPVRLVQRIARGQRKKSDRNVLHVWDLDFGKLPYLGEHSRSRLSTVKDKFPGITIVRTF